MGTNQAATAGVEKWSQAEVQKAQFHDRPLEAKSKREEMWLSWLKCGGTVAVCQEVEVCFYDISLLVTRLTES